MCIRDRPCPDDLYCEGSYGSKVLYAGRESISLPFMEALQSLRPRQRLCVILGDVMGWEIERVAEVLGAGLADTIDSLEQARASMSRTYDEELGRREPPREEVITELMMRYLYAWETGDVEGLAARLSEDAVLQLPPSPSWYEGRDAVRTHLGSHALQGGETGRWRLLPRRANGQLAFGVYRRDDTRSIYAAHSIQVLHFTGELVSEIISFEDPWLFAPFKLLPEIVVQG
jgi:RNA polymerase sigma-70 factor (ECF subfamily)